MHPATPGPAEPHVPEPQCPPVWTEGTTPTMVTLITEKLQNQSLDDLAHNSYDAGPVSQRRRRTGPTPGTQRRACPRHAGAWSASVTSSDDSHSCV